MNKRIGTALANWFLILTAPIWILPALIYLAIEGSREVRNVMTGKESIL